MNKIKLMLSKILDAFIWCIGVIIGALAVVILLAVLVGALFFTLNTECFELRDGRVMCTTVQQQ